ncbi:MAG: hypothetical protein ACI93T_003088 [Porticoccaceae bacterium]|jgi:hypothetical protein
MKIRREAETLHDFPRPSGTSEVYRFGLLEHFRPSATHPAGNRLISVT